MASHFPPPEKAGGGALATASRMALISAATFGGTELRNSIAGTAASGSSSLLRWKKWINHGSGVFEAADITFRPAVASSQPSLVKDLDERRPPPMGLP